MKPQMPKPGDIIQVSIYIYDPTLPKRLVNGKTMYQDVMGDYSMKHFSNSTIYRQMTVTGHIFWADNSTDITGLLEDGTKHKIQWEAPHGDVC